MKIKREIKIWDVEIGYNWSRHPVIARNYLEAGRKALKSSSAPRHQRFISSVILSKVINK